MNNLLQLLLGLVIAGLMVILAAPYFIEWNQYKSEIETQASKLVGRQLTVAGDVNLRLLPAPYLQLEDITVNAHESGPDAPPLLKAQAFKLWLSAAPLLRGVIEVQEVEVVKPHLRFAIDENGRSNWRQNNPSDLSLPFSPTAFSLQSMTIKDGTLEITSAAFDKGAHKSKGLVIKALNGGFSANSLKGPFKFEGTIGSDDDRQTLRLSTGSIDDKDQMRIKGILRSTKGGARYGFDGSFAKLSSHPSMNGVMTASFPFFKSTADKTGKPGKSSRGMNRVKPIEVKTSIHADSKGALFDKILVTMVHKNRPQMMTGKGRLSWDKGNIDLDGNLGARLLDADHLKDGMKVGNSLKESINNLVANLQAQSAKVDSGRFNININQIKLNGDLIQDITLNLLKNDKGLLVERLFAKLPGDNIIEVKGHFDGPPDSSLFKGSGVIRGASLGHFVTWTAGTRIDGGIHAIRSHPFTLRGDLLFGQSIWALKGVHGDIAGTSFTGKISHRIIAANDPSSTSHRGEIDLKLITSEIDTTALVGRPLAMREIIDSLLTTRASQATSSHAATPNTPPENSLLGALTKNNIMKLRLRAGRLKLEDFDGRDLVVDMFIGVDRLQINELSLRSQKGLRLHADGTINNLEKIPSGTLAATINIEDDQELKQFFSWFESGKTSLFTKKQITSLTPLRLAAMLQTSSNTGTEANIRINGIAGSSHIALTNRIIGVNLFSRREQRSIKQLELSGTISNGDGRTLLTQLVPHLAVDLAQLREIGASKIWFSAAGLPEVGLNSRIEFNSKRVTAGFDGQLGWQNGEGRFQGTTRLKAKDIASGLALMGLDTHKLQSTGSLDLTAMLDKQGGKYDFTSIKGSISQSEVEGRATLKIGDTGKKLDLVLLTSALHVSSLFAPLLENPLDKQAASGNDTVATALQLANNVEEEVGTAELIQKPVMTNRHFTSDLLQDISAELFITADKLYITDEISLENGELSATISKQKIKVNNIGGSLWGGQLQSNGDLDLSSTLTKASGKVSLTNVLIERSALVVNKTPVASGKVSLNLDFEGRGISPAGLFSLLNGSGKIRFSKTKINQLSSSVLTDIVDDELTVWKQSEDQTPFAERFKRHLQHNDFNIASATRNFTIKDGSVLLKMSQMSENQSKLDLDASMILASMTTHTRLTISPAKDAKYANLPPTNILIEGSLDALDKITPKIDTASLEQFLTVMKMEQDVNSLEELHRRDEEFAKKAAERRAIAERQREQKQLENQQLEQEPQTDIPSTRRSTPPANRSPDWNPFN